MNNDLAKMSVLYEEMYKEPTLEIQEEGKSGHGKKSDVVKLLKKYKKQGKITVEDTTNGYKVISTVNPNLFEFIHKGERALHYLRRFLQDLDKLG